MHSRLFCRRAVISFLSAAVFIAPIATWAQSDKPIRIIVPLAAG